MNKISNVDIKQLAEIYGTPLYVYDRAIIIQNYSDLKNAFVKYYTKTKIHFSVKANSNFKLLSIFKESGCGADCSSPIEMILSEKAGCFEELKDHVIAVNPYDISQTAEAYHQAIEMSKKERRERFENLQDIVGQRTIYDWISEQFEDIEKIKTIEKI